MSGKGLPFDDDDRDRRRLAMCQRHEGTRALQLLEALKGWAVESKLGCSIPPCKDLDISPADSPSELVPRERLVRRELAGHPRQVQRLAEPPRHFLGRAGAEAQLDPEFAPRFASFIETRRAVLRSVLARHGNRDAEELDTLVDMLFGALWYRLLLGHAPLDAGFAARLGLLSARALQSE